MMRFGSTGSNDLYDRYSTVVLFATFHCRGVTKVQKKMEKFFSREKRNAYIILIRYIFFSMDSLKVLRDFNTTFKVTVVLIRTLKARKGSRHAAVLTD